MHSKQLTIINRAIFIPSLIGIVIAFYVTQSFVRGSTIVCVNSGCELVRKSPTSYLFGKVPVPAVGLAGYTLLALFTFLRTTSPVNFRKYLWGILGMSLFGVGFVSWFTFTELFIIKGVCTWCAISAVNMVTIFILSLVSYHFLNQTSK